MPFSRRCRVLARRKCCFGCLQSDGALIVSSLWQLRHSQFAFCTVWMQHNNARCFEQFRATICSLLAFFECKFTLCCCQFCRDTRRKSCPMDSVSLVATFGLTHFTRQFFLPAPAHSAVFLYTKDKVLRVEFTDIDHAGITLAMADLPEEHTVMRIWGKDRGDYIDFDEVVAEATHEEHEPQHRQLPPRRLVPGANTRTLVQFLEQHREKPYCPRTWNCNHFAAALYRHLRAAPSSLS
ncbi:MAG: hypothetical protein MHM6MM_003861 [Cercozoa sp. M6MM]